MGGSADVLCWTLPPCSVAQQQRAAGESMTETDMTSQTLTGGGSVALATLGRPLFLLLLGRSDTEWQGLQGDAMPDALLAHLAGTKIGQLSLGVL